MSQFWFQKLTEHLLNAFELHYKMKPNEGYLRAAVIARANMEMEAALETVYRESI